MKKTETVFDVTVQANKDTIEMNFSNGSDNDNDSEHKGNHLNGNTRKPSGRGYWPLILIGLLFVSLVSLLVYFFAFRNSGTTEFYGDDAVVYKMDFDKNGGPDYVDGSTAPDYSKYTYQAGTDFADYLYGDDNGRLAVILINGQYDAKGQGNVTLKVIQSNETSSIYYLQGKYLTTDKKG